MATQAGGEEALIVNKNKRFRKEKRATLTLVCDIWCTLTFLPAMWDTDDIDQ